MPHTTEQIEKVMVQNSIIEAREEQKWPTRF
jgi:hypothetical protein